MNQPAFDVSSAVAVLNQTLEYAYPTITVVGELSEFRVSKGKWLYFDIKDEMSRLKCFGTLYQMKMPLEDGMLVEVIAKPRLHNLYGFSLNIETVRPVGEGSIRKAADLLKAKLEREGLFAVERKRTLPYPPEHIALIASAESAAFADFIKIVKIRWPHVQIDLWEVQVQGVVAEEEIVRSLQLVNEQAISPEVVVIIRGGGSAEDLAAFSTESVTRAVAASRIPTLVAIGHETDVSLAELAADLRASTPSNAAELLVPDKHAVLGSLNTYRTHLEGIVSERLVAEQRKLQLSDRILQEELSRYFANKTAELSHAKLQVESYHPKQVLRRGYALIRSQGKLLKKGQKVAKGDLLEVELEQQHLKTRVEKTAGKQHK